MAEILTWLFILSNGLQAARLLRQHLVKKGCGFHMQRAAPENTEIN